jgi:hypothetical protein
MEVNVKDLEIQISGKIQNNNLDAWKETVISRINNTNMNLISDRDFVDASDDVKYFKNAEAAIKEAKVKAIEQTEEIQLLFSKLDEYAEQARQTRLNLERQIRSKKQEIKAGLVSNAMQEVHDYIAEKPEIYTSLDNSKYLQKHIYESVIKGKSTINSVQISLEGLVNSYKTEIDYDSDLAKRNYAIIEAVSVKDRLLLHDVDYLIRLPENELKLTIENRKAKLSELDAKKQVTDTQKELNSINNEALHGINDKEKSHYVISIEVFSTRYEAIEMARELKNLLGGKKQLTDIKLAKRHEQ